MFQPAAFAPSRGCGTITLMEDDNNDAVGVAQPGQTVTPGSQTPAPAAPPSPQPAAPPAQPPAQASPPQPQPVPAPPQAEQVPEQPQAAEGSFFSADPEQAPEAAADGPPGEAITWTASEFIAHAKSFGWYFVLAVVAVAVAAAIYLVTRDMISSGVIIVAALFLGFYAGHKPREMQYRLDASGLNVGEKYFSYNQFRSFAVLPEGAFSSIVFMPLKRFAVPTTIYYPPEEEDRIVGMIGGSLPLEQHGHDAVDRLMHRIHF
jgi:hypothetical protein